MFSEADKKFYVGFTTGLGKRLEDHQRGAVASTAHRRPVKLIYYEACLNEKDALKREKYFKTGFGRRFLRNRLETYLNDLG